MSLPGTHIGPGVSTAIPSSDITVVDTAITANTGGSPKSVTKPAGVSTGDLLLFIGGMRGNGTFTTVPSGLSSEVSSATNPSINVWTKTAGASEPSSYSFGHDLGSGTLSVLLVVLRNASIDVVGTIANTSTDLTEDAPSITTTVDGALLSIFCASADGVTITPPTGTVISNVNQSNTPDISVTYENETAGSTGTRTATRSGTAQSFGGVLISLSGDIV